MGKGLPLTGYNVVDLGRGQAAAMAALFLNAAGATVVKLDDSAGAVPLGPVADALWNRDKTRRPIDSHTQEGRAAIRDALSTADIVIHDRLPSEAAVIGIDAVSLDADFPHLVHVAIGGWPAGHPLEETPVDDALVLAEAGILDEQAAVRRDGPVWLRFPLGSNIAAYLAAAGALARLHARNRTGRGGPVVTSLAQGAMAPMMMHWSRAERPSRSVLFGMPKDSGATLFECSDGRWIHTMGAPQRAPSVGDRLEAMPADVRERYNAKYIDAVVQYPGLGKERGAVEAIFRTRPSGDWLAELWAADVSAQPALPMGALYEDEQAAANAYIRTVEDPHFGRTVQPGAPFDITARDTESSRPVPGSDDLRFPLEGVKVLDVGNFLAGPFAAMLLGDLGAEVVKVEAIGGDPLRPVEWAFNGCQRSKRSIAVELKSEAGRTVMEKLIGWADIIHHNQRMPAAEKLGFGWNAVHALNPAAIYCHVSSYGPKGPRKDWPGYDQLFQAASGWEYESAGEGNPPMWCRFGMMDHLGGLASLVATLAALVRRDATGEGEFVAASLLGASSASLETLMLPDNSIAPLPQLDGEQMGLEPTKRLYRCLDGWIVVSDATIEGGGEALARLGGADELEARLAALSPNEALALLRGEGLPASIVRCDHRDAFLDDPANHALQLSANIEHAIYGDYRFLGAFWGFGDLSVMLDRPMPLLGEHSRAILAEIGFADEESAGLIESGAVGVIVNQPA
jgi:crotonobetainyl-CoA:carnitine CoA-transferase CaiB-like acyl-CoA transferase